MEAPGNGLLNFINIFSIDLLLKFAKEFYILIKRFILSICVRRERKRTAREKWPPKLLRVRSTRKEGLPP